MFENLTGIIIAFITGVVGPILVLYIKSKLEGKKEKPDMVRETLRVSELVTSKIEHIREEFDADRVWITQFHNGGHYYPTGKSMAKFSMLYETVGLGVGSVQSNFQNIPVNLFSKSINELLLNDSIVITDFKDETIGTYGLKSAAEATGTNASYVIGLFDIVTDKCIGTMGVDYREKKKLTQTQKDFLIERGSRLAGYLSIYLKSK
jgi:hypothetical protein